MKILNDLSSLKTTVKENINTKSNATGYLKRKKYNPSILEALELHTNITKYQL